MRKLLSLGVATLLLCGILGTAGCDPTASDESSTTSPSPTQPDYVINGVSVNGVMAKAQELLRVEFEVKLVPFGSTVPCDTTSISGDAEPFFYCARQEYIAVPQAITVASSWTPLSPAATLYKLVWPAVFALPLFADDPTKAYCAAGYIAQTQFNPGGTDERDLRTYLKFREEDNDAIFSGVNAAKAGQPISRCNTGGAQ